MDLQTSIGIHDAFTEPLRNMTNALNMTISSFEELQQTSENSVDTTSLQAARDELAKAEIAFSNIGNEVATAENHQKEFNREIEQGNIQAGNLYSTFKKVAAVIGVGSMFKSGFEVFKGFEQSMKNLQSVTQAGATQMEALSYTAKKMGETTVFSASQSADAMIELAKGGLEVYEIIESIPSVLDLAVVSQMELAQASGLAVDIMRGFNLQAEDMGRVVDLIAYTSINATTDITQMGEAFAYSAKVADTFNASLEQTSAIIGMMSTAAKGSKAGMALRSGLGRMASPTADAQKWLDQLQINFIDPATNSMRDLGDIVDDLAAGFGELSNAAQIQAAKSIFGEQAYNAWLAVIQEGVGAMDKWLDEFNNEAIDTAERMKEIMLSTTEGILQIHKSEVESIWINFYEGLADGVVGEAFQSVLAGMRTALEIGLTMATGAIVAVGYAIQFVANNLDLLIPILVVVTTVWAVLNAEKLVGIALDIKSIAIKFAQTASYYMLTAAMMVQATVTFILTLATQGLSAAFAAVPFGWVIAGFVIIVAIVFLAVAAFNRLAGASVSAAGIIIGAFAVVGAFLYNLFLSVFDFIWNIGITLANGFIAFAEFLINVFISPVTAIANLFVDLGDFVLGILESIASAIDWIFGSNLAGAVEGWRSNLQGWAESNIRSNAVEFDRIDVDHGLERINYGEAWTKGYDLGGRLGNKVSDFFSFGTDSFDMDSFLQNEMAGLGDLGGLDDTPFTPGDFTDSLMGPGGAGGPLKDIADKAGKTAGNTKGIMDKLDATEEDIKYLRDLAASNVVNRFTSNQFVIEMDNDFQVDNELDLDGVVDSIATGLEENIEVRMEGI